MDPTPPVAVPTENVCVAGSTTEAALTKTAWVRCVLELEHVVLTTCIHPAGAAIAVPTRKPTAATRT